MTHGCEHCGCGTDHARQPVDPALYARTAPAFNCITYPGAGPHYTPGTAGCAWCGMTREQIAAEPEHPQQPGGPGPYTHIVKRADGYIAGWFVGEPPASFIAECNASVPDNPAHAEQIPAWPDETRPEIDARPQTEGNPYQAYTPESRVFEIAQVHGRQAAWEALAGVKPDVAGYRELLARLPVLRTRPTAGGPKLRRDDLPGYSQADLMSQAGWVPHDGMDLRDELSGQYERDARTAFWNEMERRALAALPHKQVGDRTQLGIRFITCACGTTCSGGIGDTIARQNFEHHLKRAREARQA